MIFHILHGALHTFMKPSFQPPRILIQPLRTGDPAMVESKITGPAFDKARMKVFIQVYYLILPEYLEFNNFLNLPS